MALLPLTRQPTKHGYDGQVCFLLLGGWLGRVAKLPVVHAGWFSSQQNSQDLRACRERAMQHQASDAVHQMFILECELIFTVSLLDKSVCMYPETSASACTIVAVDPGT